MNTLSTALSGLQAAQVRLNAAANNVANGQTEGYQRDVVQARPQAGGGVTTQVNNLPQPGADLARDVVEQKSAAYAFQANLQVVKTADAMVGRLLNARA